MYIEQSSDCPFQHLLTPWIEVPMGMSDTAVAVELVISVPLLSAETGVGPTLNPVKTSPSPPPDSVLFCGFEDACFGASKALAARFMPSNNDAPAQQ